MRSLMLSLAAGALGASLLLLPSTASAQEGATMAQAEGNAAPRRRRRRRPPRQRPPAPEAEAEAETAPAPEAAPESGVADVAAAAEGAGDGDEDVQTVGSLRRSNNLEFDARLVRGQRAGAGAVVLFNRGSRPLPPLTGERRGFTRATVVDVLGPEALARPARDGDDAAEEGPREAPAAEAAPAEDAGAQRRRRRRNGRR